MANKSRPKQVMFRLSEAEAEKLQRKVEVILMKKRLEKT